MASEKQYTIPLMPWRGSLLTAGSQSTMPENMLWEAENVSVRLDGTLTKRPGVRQWGQTIMEPDSTAVGATVQAFVPFIDTTAPMVTTDNSTGKITTTVISGELRTAVAKGDVPLDTENLVMHHPGNLPAGSKWSLRFMFHGINLPSYTVAATYTDTFAFRGQAAAGSGKEFAIWAGGIYYKRASDNTYVLIANTTTVGEGVWSMIEVRVDDGVGGSTQVYLNDVLVATISSSLLADVSPNGFFEFRWLVEDSGAANTQYNTVVIAPMYNDTTTAPFAGVEIVAGEYFPYQTSSGARVRSLVIAAGSYIYHDNGELAIWRPLLAKQNPNVFFATFQRTLIWCDFADGGSSSVRQWTGEVAPLLLADAPPIQFAVEHKARLFGAGDKEFPLRLYYTGSRQANLWFTPTEDNAETETDAVLEAGYIPIPARRGDAITAIWGDYYGLLIVATRTGVWQLSGSGPQSWSLEAVSQSHGVESSLGIMQVGNDLWYGSRFGIHSLLTTDKYGQLSTQKPSTAIGNLWSQQTSGGAKIARDFLGTSKIVFSPQQQLIVVAVPLSGNQNSDDIYVYSQVTEGWYGPWSIESRALWIAELVSPLLEVVMHGSSDGRVGYTYPYLKADYETGVVSMRIATAALSGRTVDPSFHKKVKTWKNLYLYIQPRGKWDFSVSWYGDNQIEVEPRVISQIQEPEPLYVLTDDFRLDESPDGVLRSDEDIRVIKIPIDERSVYLYLFIEESAAGEDLIIQGADIEFTASAPEGT